LGLIKNSDVYGDVVNTTSRVEHQSQPDQIFVSQSLVETARSMGIGVESAGTAELKGKEEAVELYRLDWASYTPKPPVAKPPANPKLPMLALVVVVVIVIGIILIGVRPGSDADSSKIPVQESTTEAAPQQFTAGDIVDAVVGNTNLPAALENAGEPASREEFLAAGFRGLSGEAGQIVTRAEFAMLLEDLSALSTGDTNLPTKHIGAESSPFMDTAPTHPAFNAIMNATEAGFLQLRESREFAPADPVTRPEMEAALIKF